MANIQAMIAYYESLDKRLAGMTEIIQSRHYDKSSKVTMSSSVRHCDTAGESSILPIRHALDISNVTNFCQLKRSPAFHRRRIRQKNNANWAHSVIRWQERATKCQSLALTQNYLEHLGYAGFRTTQTNQITKCFKYQIGREPQNSKNDNMLASQMLLVSTCS